MTTPELAVATAERWTYSGKACPECHGALYSHAALAPLQLGYSRCPNCHLNYVQRNGVLDIDRVADSLLDELARRTSLISFPSPHVAKHDPETGALNPTRQPHNYTG